MSTKANRKFNDSQLQHIYDGAIAHHPTNGTYSRKVFDSGYYNEGWTDVLADGKHDLDKAFALWLAGFDTDVEVFTDDQCLARYYFDDYLINQGEIPIPSALDASKSSYFEELSETAKKFVLVATVAALPLSNDNGWFSPLTYEQYDAIVCLARAAINEATKG
jgi:hypothetical protein